MTKNLSIVVFTGAGASAQFNNPPTKEFKEKLLNLSKDNRLLNSLLKHKDYPDIEHVLECLKLIKQIHNNHAAKYLGHNDNNIVVNQNPPISMYEIFSQYLGVERFIMQELFKTYRIESTVHPQLRNFYGGLFSLLKKFTNRIIIGTTNYDLAVEDFCRLESSSYTCVDGFKVSGSKFVWMPQKWDEFIAGVTDTPVILLKIHGSLNWINRGNIEKSDNIEYSPTNEGQANTIVPPTLSPKDAENIEPFKTILTRFELSLDNADVCIAIGSSFRDDIIAEKLIKFLDLGKHLIIISPSCYENYSRGICQQNEISDAECVEWAKAQSSQRKRKITFINESVNDQTSLTIFNKIENAITNIHKTDQNQQKSSLKPDLRLEDIKTEIATVNEGNGAHYFGKISAIIKNIGKTSAKEVKIYTIHPNFSLQLRSLIQNESVIKKSYYPIQGSVLTNGQAQIPKNMIPLNAQSPFDIGFWLEYNYENIESEEIIFTFRVGGTNTFDQFTVYEDQQIKNEKNEWKNLNAGNIGAGI